MAVQALLAPGDIAIVDRNCHKSHHYGMVLAGAQPIYVEAFPMTEYSMYGAVPLKTIKQALLNAKADGRLDRVKMLDLTNCTFDGHIYNTRRVMEECLAIKPDLIFLWDEAWFGFARFSPFLRRRTAMGAANEIEAWMHDPKSVAAYEKQQAELGKNPSDEVLLKTRLIPDPRQIRLRVYQTNSTHKSMSAIRQGSMLSVKDVEFHTVEQQFKEAVFTHASTSPTSSSSPASTSSRRQMELEGYGLVANAIEIAFAIRKAVNSNPLISKYFRFSARTPWCPAQYRQSGFTDYLAPARTGRRPEEPGRRRVLPRSDPHDAGVRHRGLRRHAVQGHPGQRLQHPDQQDIAQLGVVPVQHQQHPQRRRASGEGAGRDRGRGRPRPDAGRRQCEEDLRRAGQEPDDRCARPAELLALPRQFPWRCRHARPTRATSAAASTRPMTQRGCEYIRLGDPEIDRRLKAGPDLVSASFVIPYPPGFPIMVPGQVITQETIDFMRKLDVKEIHGYDAKEGLKLVKRRSLGQDRRRQARLRRRS